MSQNKENVNITTFDHSANNITTKKLSKVSQAIEELDNLFYLTFKANEQPMVDWVTLKFFIKDVNKVLKDSKFYLENGEVQTRKTLGMAYSTIITQLREIIKELDNE